MRTLNGKKLILWALSLILCLAACGESAAPSAPEAV